jgi:hypothetical protein
MGEFVLGLLGLGAALALLAAVGHGIWVATGAVFRALTGRHETRVRRQC